MLLSNFARKLLQPTRANRGTGKLRFLRDAQRSTHARLEAEAVCICVSRGLRLSPGMLACTFFPVSILEDVFSIADREGAAL